MILISIRAPWNHLTNPCPAQFIQRQFLVKFGTVGRKSLPDLGSYSGVSSADATGYREDGHSLPTGSSSGNEGAVSYGGRSGRPSC